MDSFLLLLLEMCIAIWLYTVFGYPILTAILGWLCQAPLNPNERFSPSISLIIPAHNEEAVIGEKLANTAQIAYPADQLEILVASDGSEDRTVPIVKELGGSKIRLLDFRERRGKSSVMNDAVEQSRGELICLCDANVMFRPEALRRMVQRFTDPTIGAVTGDVRLASQESDFGSGESLYYRLERAMQLGESAMGSTIGVDGGMYVIRRELFRPLRAATILDDFVVSMGVILAGSRVVYEPSAIAGENATPSSSIEYRRRVRVTAGAVQTLLWRIWPSPWKQPIVFCQWTSHKLLRWMSPIWLTLILISSLLLSRHDIVVALLLAGQLAVYVGAGVAWLMPRLRTWPVLGVCYYFCLSHLAMFEGLYKGLLGRQPVTWRRTQRTANS